MLADPIIVDEQPWRGLGPEVVSWIQGDGSQISPLAEHIVSALDAWSNDILISKRDIKTYPLDPGSLLETLLKIFP
jgi:hypothetical protein